MDTDRKNILQKFFEEYKNSCLGLRNWLGMRCKTFKLIDALNCIYEVAEGDFIEMDKIIKQIIDKGKTPRGRSQVHNTTPILNNKIDIIVNGDKLELVNYNPD